MTTTTSPTTQKTTTYEVTDSGCQVLLCLTSPLHFLACCPGILGTKTLILEDEEAVLDSKCCLWNITTRRPYGELGSVDNIQCFCCNGFISNLTKTMPIFPGCGCGRNNTKQVEEIVAELKARMKQRGDTGQIKKTETAVEEIAILREEVKALRGDMKLILNHIMGVQQQTAAETIESDFMER